MACVENPNIRFLSRYDKSAANIKESSIWTAIGQTPWAHPYSSWYHRYIEFPFAALRAACALGEYTLTDKGTWLSIEEEIRDKMSVFVCYGFVSKTCVELMYGVESEHRCPRWSIIESCAYLSRHEREKHSHGSQICRLDDSKRWWAEGYWGVWSEWCYLVHWCTKLLGKQMEWFRSLLEFLR